MYLNDLGTFNWNHHLFVSFDYMVCFQCYIVDIKIKILGNAYSLPILVGKLSLVCANLRTMYLVLHSRRWRSDFDSSYDAVYVRLSTQPAVFLTDKVINALSKLTGS